ncbi:SdrD B-like domain-containing protein [Staphylococcus aureus]
MSGVTVTLRLNDKVLKTVTTDEKNGKYQFTDLNNGTYKSRIRHHQVIHRSPVTSPNHTEKDSNGLNNNRCH